MSYPSTDADRLRERACEIRCCTGSDAGAARKLAREQLAREAASRVTANKCRPKQLPVADFLAARAAKEEK